MIGFGRAVGETMIVLMATGNTPVMEWSIFNGMRTISANIAVELPEAPHRGLTLPRAFPQRPPGCSPSPSCSTPRRKECASASGRGTVAYESLPAQRRPLHLAVGKRAGLLPADRFRAHRRRRRQRPGVLLAPGRRPASSSPGAPPFSAKSCGARRCPQGMQGPQRPGASRSRRVTATCTGWTSAGSPKRKIVSTTFPAEAAVLERVEWGDMLGIPTSFAVDGGEPVRARHSPCLAAARRNPSPRRRPAEADRAAGTGRDRRGEQGDRGDPAA